MLKQKTQIILLIVVILATVTVFLPKQTDARGLVPCGGYMDDAGTVREPPCTVLHMFALVARVTNFLIGFAGVFAVWQILNAGFWLTTTMGNEESITTHKKSIQYAVVGFALAMFAYVFINTAVNILLTEGTEGKTIDLRNPWCYVVPDETQCQKQTK